MMGETRVVLMVEGAREESVTPIARQEPNAQPRTLVHGMSHGGDGADGSEHLGTDKETARPSDLWSWGARGLRWRQCNQGVNVELEGRQS